MPVKSNTRARSSSAGGRRATGALKRQIQENSEEKEKYITINWDVNEANTLGKDNLDPAQVAATIMLEWGMLVQGIKLKAIKRPGALVCVITLSPEWTAPARTAYQWMVFGEREDSASSLPSIHKRSWKTEFIRTHAPTGVGERTDQDIFAESMWRRHTILGFAPELSWLPNDLVLGADITFSLVPLFPGAVSEIAYRLTGQYSSTQLTADEARLVDPRLLRLARRPSQSATSYVGKLQQLLQASKTVNAVTSSAGPASQTRHVSLLSELSGMDEAVKWGTTLKADLEAHKAGKLAWKDVDRGVLLSGPPGCGKTMFAQSLATACGVPLIEGSWSRWMANGLGHQGNFMIALRKCFADARKSGQCILFIDEIDSFPNRAMMVHDYADWDIQVVNALLAEIDGTEGREGVILVGACNNPHLLDPALVRSGRLDRHIRIGLPDQNALMRILREHLGADLTSESLERVALLALGSSGADVERLVRGARRSARNANRDMNIDDLLSEVSGTDNRTPEARRIAAIHEAGHAAVAITLGMTINGISLRDGDISSGEIRTSIKTDYVGPNEISNRLTFLLAGRAAEDVIVGHVTTGSGGSQGSDLSTATVLALRATCEYGFEEGRGLLWVPVPDSPSEIGRVLNSNPNLSKAVEKRLDDAYLRSKTLVAESQEAILALSEALQARLSLDHEEVVELIRSAKEGGA